MTDKKTNQDGKPAKAIVNVAEELVQNLKKGKKRAVS